MPESTQLDLSRLPRNRSGGLNLVWAVRQALTQLGLDAKPPQVKEFIDREYRELGRRATQKPASLSVAITQQRRKMRDERLKTPAREETVQPNVVKEAAASNGIPVAATKKDALTFEQLRDFVNGTLVPAMKIVAEAEQFAGGDRNKLKAALSTVEDAEEQMGGRDRLLKVVGAFTG